MRKAVPQKKGWFQIPGVQDGSRTFKEQTRGLGPLFERVKGKAVLDLGCAEGLILKHCTELGARVAAGIEFNADFVKVANDLLQGTGAAVFEADLNEPFASPVQADIVLMLAVLHKMRNPTEALRAWAPLAGELIVIRLPIGSKGEFPSKYRPENRCNVNAQLPGLGFALERTEPGPRGELVQYWQRTA